MIVPIKSTHRLHRLSLEGVLWCFNIAFRDFHLTHVSQDIHVGSLVAVEPNGMGLPSTGLRLGAWSYAPITPNHLK